MRESKYRKKERYQDIYGKQRAYREAYKQYTSKVSETLEVYKNFISSNPLFLNGYILETGDIDNPLCVAVETDFDTVANT